jgi:hypothetical protein
VDNDAENEKLVINKAQLILIKQMARIYKAFTFPKFVVANGGQLYIENVWLDPQAKENFDVLAREYIELDKQKNNDS